MRPALRQHFLGALLGLLPMLAALAGDVRHSHTGAGVRRSISHTTSIHCDCQDRIKPETNCYLCRPQSTDRTASEGRFLLTNLSPILVGTIRHQNLRLATAGADSANARAPPLASRG